MSSESDAAIRYCSGDYRRGLHCPVERSNMLPSCSVSRSPPRLWVAPDVPRFRGEGWKEKSASDMEFGPNFDAVFSNAALHWMKDVDAVIGRVARALPNGRFVAEMGGSKAAPSRGISRIAGRCRPAVAAGLRAHQSAGPVEWIPK